MNLTRLDFEGPSRLKSTSQNRLPGLLGDETLFKSASMTCIVKIHSAPMLLLGHKPMITIIYKKLP